MTRLIMAWVGVCCSLTAAELVVKDSDLPRVPATEPTNAVSTLRIRDGYRAELAASEPLIASPVTMAFDEDGRLYVVEMVDYSERREEQLGRIKLLEDTNGDGRFDTATIFAAGLAWPTAIICYDGGVFVGASPDIIYLKDTNADRKADVRRVVLTGFGSGAPKLNVQQLLNSFTWGIDNRIYGALGGNASTVTNLVNRAAKPVELRNRDFSFDPRTFDLRPESGGGQWGITFDAEGNKFTCSNSRHIVAEMYPAAVATRNPYLTLPRPDVDIAVDGPTAEIYRVSPDEPWRVLRTKWRVSGAVTGPVEGGGRVSGYFTGVSGLTINTGDAFPRDARGNAFIAESGGNLVHRKVLRRNGLNFVAERPADEQKREFLASTDNWFRPVWVANAPDGALYIVDMYREVIEHPWSLPPELKSRLDLNSGNDRGRIYRVLPDGFKQRPPPALSKASAPELIQTLAHENGWHRETASRLLFERKEGDAGLLAKALAESPDRLARLRALHLLASLNALTPPQAVSAFLDRDPVVRAHAVRLGTQQFPGNREVAQARGKLVGDADIQVRYEVAFAETNSVALRELALRDVESTWMSWAVLTGTRDCAGALLASFATNEAFLKRANAAEFTAQLASIVGTAGRSSEIAAAIPVVAQSPAAFRLAESLGTGLARSKKSFSSPEVAAHAAPLFARAQVVLTNSAAAESERVRAARLLRFSDFQASGAALDTSLHLSVPPALQAAAVESLVAYHDGRGVTNVLGRWETLAPSTRSRTISLLLTRTADAMALLDEVENSVVAKNQFTAADVERLFTSSEAVLRDRAKQLFRRDQSPRSQVVAQYRPSLSLKGDVARGEKIFAERCVTCHRTGSQGFAVGPDMTSVVANGKEKILQSIVDPHAEVAAAYLAYTVETKAGDAYLGIVSADDGRTLTLKMPATDPVQIPRPEITVLRSNDRSLMPDGLEDELSQQDMADLLEFIVNTKPSK